MRNRLITAAAAAGLLAAPLAAPIPAMAQSGNPLNSIFSCQASGNKQAGGAAVGAVIGGLLGNTTAGKNSRGSSTVLGAALGAAAGSYIGCRMQTSDQRRAEAATREALDYGRDASWTNPETGASGRVRVVSSNPYVDDNDYSRDDYARPVSLRDVRFAANVQPQATYYGAAGRYEASSRVNLRSQPGQRSQIVGRLQPGERFRALARVRGYNGDWLLVGRDRTAIGYVSEELVTPVDQNYSGGDGRGYDRDRDGYDRNRDGEDRGQRRSERMCRTFEQTFTTSGGRPETSQYTACQSASGEWVVQG
jgi:surface antigen